MEELCVIITIEVNRGGNIFGLLWHDAIWGRR